MTKEILNWMIENNIMPVGVVSTTPFKTHSNASIFVDLGEINDLPSLTIPDQSLTVEELVYRYTHGLDLGGGRVGVYEDDLEIQFPANWDKLDLSEKHEFYKAKEEEYKAIQDRLLEERNKISESKKQEAIDAAVKKKLDAIREMRGKTTAEPKEGEDRVQGELNL